MKFTNMLLRIEITALISLFVFSAAISTYAGIWAYFGPSNVLTSYETGLIVFINSLIAGAVIISVIGAPIYTAMQFMNKANWSLVVLLGIIPGIGISILDITIGPYAIICGLGVAVTTHVHYVKHSNKSLNMDAQKARAS